jgi:hypothetical protein
MSARKRSNSAAARVRASTRKELSCRQYVENRRLQRHDDAFYQLEYMPQLFAMQACRGVKDDVGGVLGRPCRLLGLYVPAGDARQGRRAQLEPLARRLLAVDVAEHDAIAALREPCRQVSCQRGFADAALGVGDEEGFHRVAQGSSTDEPVVLRATRSIWACAASLSA